MSCGFSFVYFAPAKKVLIPERFYQLKSIQCIPAYLGDGAKHIAEIELVVVKVVMKPSDIRRQSHQKLSCAIVKRQRLHVEYVFQVVNSLLE